ncbi:hypothetical protein HOR19_gp18 [Phage MedPE-SWcel-C56]|uniref:Uncharacterized protein n=1 Tax=Phage MedPE-SWcel-C56 TaxID=1871314 RepID=A0A1B1IY11_9CAUD|nr:hypothetical protein HOR19_gp18 [Phage MedPE-SWcel-C56]ANS06211.1 hypothetical protein [Phage MedPE-SWcel-C56]
MNAADQKVLDEYAEIKKRADAVLRKAKEEEELIDLRRMIDPQQSPKENRFLGFQSSQGYEAELVVLNRKARLEERLVLTQKEALGIIDARLERINGS